MITQEDIDHFADMQSPIMDMGYYQQEAVKTAIYTDPIIYPTHPAVMTLKEKLIESGSAYDLTNNASIYNWNERIKFSCYACYTWHRITYNTIN